MRKKIYTAPVTETVAPCFDPIQYETVPVYLSTDNPNAPIEANASFFDDGDDDDRDSFFDD